MKIDKYEDTIDSRDIDERINELEIERDVYVETHDSADVMKWALEYPDDVDELHYLTKLRDEAKDYCPDWDYGATLIRYSYFEEYAQQMCEDIGDIPREMNSYIVIDWETTAENLKVDYTEVEFDGIPYLVR